jgi:hypothetical protein
MAKVFISHSSKDDGFVRDLRAALADHGQDGWIDSRELRGGDPLWSEIRKAIQAASGYAVVVSPDALQSKWVGKELRHALKVQKKRGKEKYPVIPLALNDTKLGVLEQFFGEEPTYIPISSGAGGIDAAINAILIALGVRLGADVAPTPQPRAEPLEELVLELTDLAFDEQNGVRRPSARARLVYEPAAPGLGAMEDLGHPHRHRGGRRQRCCGRGSDAQGDRSLPPILGSRAWSQVVVARLNMMPRFEFTYHLGDGRRNLAERRPKELTPLADPSCR